MKAYLFHRSGDARMEPHYTAPGKFHMAHASVTLDKPVVEGDVVQIHSGYGITHDYEVKAVDEEVALLQLVL